MQMLLYTEIQTVTCGRVNTNSACVKTNKPKNSVTCVSVILSIHTSENFPQCAPLMALEINYDFCET
jgi:hypothetical protein